jgi:hypothetical protein
LIIEKLDRFSRDEVLSVFDDVSLLLRNGVEIYTCVDQTHYTKHDIDTKPFLIHQAIMAIQSANDYSKSLADKIVKAFDFRLANCSQGHKMELGTWQPRWIDFIGEHKQVGTFKLNDHAATIQRMVTEYLSGLSMYSIAAGLIKDNIPTLAGGHWSQGTIGHLLGNETLIGTTTIKGVRLEHYYPAVITPKEYEQLQAKLRQNVAKKGGSSRASDYIANLFRNRCKCSVCGGTITSQKSGNHHMYFCKGVRVGVCKQKTMLNIGTVEVDFFLHYLQQSPNDLFGKQTSEHSAKANTIQTTLAKLDKDIAGAAELIGVIDIAEVRAKLTTLEHKRQTAKAELDALNTSMLSELNAPKALVDIKAVFKTLYTHPFIKLQGRPGDYTASFNKADLLKIKADDWTRMEKAADQFEQAQQIVTDTLKDNTTRRRLLELIPSIVQGLVIDLKGQAYRVVSHNGQQSEWRKVG